MGGQEIKVPPQSLDAERSVLGAMMIDEDAIAVALERLERRWFYEESHRVIFDTILDLYHERRQVDLVTVSTRLKDTGRLDEVGGVPYLSELIDGVPSAANIEHYALIVREKGILRELIKNATQIIHECYESTGSASEILDTAERLIFDVADLRHHQTAVMLKDLVKATIEQIDKLYQRKQHVTGLPSGLVDLDRMTSGFQPADMIIIAGRPSMGKSALAGSIVEYLGVEQKIPVAFFSLEMSKQQLVQRMLCSQARVDAHKVRTGHLAAADWPKLTSAAGRLSSAPVFIDDTPAISALELRAKARRLKSQHNIQLLVLDYLQLMRATHRSDSRQQEISEISRSIKALARELNIPVVALSQLSRAVESRDGKRPQLSDLRESGAIEQDADVVMLLYRPEYYDHNVAEEQRGVAEVIIAKQRNGPVGTVRLAFIKEYMRFENLACVD